jgi:hypothetical protein
MLRLSALGDASIELKCSRPLARNPERVLLMEMLSKRETIV